MDYKEAANLLDHLQNRLRMLSLLSNYTGGATNVRNLTKTEYKNWGNAIVFIDCSPKLIGKLIAFWANLLFSSLYEELYPFNPTCVRRNIRNIDENFQANRRIRNIHKHESSPLTNNLGVVRGGRLEAAASSSKGKMDGVGEGEEEEEEELWR